MLVTMGTGGKGVIVSLKPDSNDMDNLTGVCTLLHPPDLESSSHVRSQHTRENIGMQMTHGHTMLATISSVDCYHAECTQVPG